MGFCLVDIKKEVIEIINAKESVKKKECPYTVGGNVNWYSHYGKHGGSLKKPELTYIQHSHSGHISGANANSKRYRHTNVYSGITEIQYLNIVLFKIAKTWKQPKCPSMDEWINKM